MAVTYRVDVDINEEAVPRFRSAVNEGLENVADFFTSVFKKNAPVDTGEFMRSIDWAFVDDNKVIVGSSDVPGKVWALEHGHSSQAPNGIFKVNMRRKRGEAKRIFIATIQSKSKLS